MKLAPPLPSLPPPPVRVRLRAFSKSRAMPKALKSRLALVRLWPLPCGGDGDDGIETPQESWSISVGNGSDTTVGIVTLPNPANGSKGACESGTKSSSQHSQCDRRTMRAYRCGRGSLLLLLLLAMRLPTMLLLLA